MKHAFVLKLAIEVTCPSPSLWIHFPFVDTYLPFLGFPSGSVVKNSHANAGDVGLILGPGRSTREGKGNSFQYSCLKDSMDRGVWQATGVTTNLTQFSGWAPMHLPLSWIWAQVFSKSWLIKISITSDMQMIPPLCRNQRGTEEPLDESERGEWKTWLKTQHSKNLIMASSPITSWQIDGEQWKQWQTLFTWAPKLLQMVSAAMKLKDACSLEEKL